MCAYRGDLKTDEEKDAWFSTPYTATSADKSTRKVRRPIHTQLLPSPARCCPPPAVLAAFGWRRHREQLSLRRGKRD